MNNDTTLLNILLALICGFVVLMVILLVAAFFGMRWLRRIISPDIGEMQRKLDDLRRTNPALSNDALIRKIIQQQSFRAGVVGAIAGLGGFVTLPVALPADILLSMRIQSAMVQFIAMIYNQQSSSPEAMQLQTTLVMSGGVRVTESTISLIMRGVARLLGKSLSIVIPVIGAVVGFIVNYGMAQATGNIAMRWYSSRQAGTKPLISGAVR